MTILQVCAYAAPYAGNFIASLTLLENKLKGLGHTTIYAFPETAKDKDWCKEISKRTKVYYLPIANARILPKTYRIFKEIYKENNIDLVHSHFELYDIPATVVAPKTTKIYWHLHDALEGIYNQSSNLKKLLWKLQYSIFSKRAVLLSVSEKHRDFVIKLGFNKSKAKYIPNGLNTKRIKSEFNQIKEFDFLLFGWDYYRKGVDLALKAGGFIESSNFRLAVVAEESTWNNIDEVNIANMSFLVKQEPIDDINKLYNNSKCFLHISRAEGLSYALLEAIYAGLPVICSDIKENLFAKEFPTVVFVKSENIQEITNAMKRVLNNELNFSNDDYQKSQKIIDEKYSLNAWSENLLKHYKL